VTTPSPEGGASRRTLDPLAYVNLRWRSPRQSSCEYVQSCVVIPVE
jgi:hypothetical protein